MTQTTFDSPASTERGSIMLTGVCGNLGRRLARRLHRIRPLIGVDHRPFWGKPRDVEHHEVDLRSNRVQELFRGRRIQALVHLGVMHDPRRRSDEHHTFNVRGFARLLDYVQTYDVKKVVFISSADVYGPRADNPQFLNEDAPLLAASRFSEIRDLIEVDMLAQSFFWKCPQTETVILRPVHILGTVNNAPSNYLRLATVPTLAGFDPMVQFIHQDDVVQAVLKALAPGSRGIFNVAGPPPVALSKALRVLGRKTRMLPYGFLRFGVDQMFRYKLTSFPAPEVDFIRYSSLVDDERARKLLGFTPHFDLKSTLFAVDAERWI